MQFHNLIQVEHLRASFYNISVTKRCNLNAITKKLDIKLNCNEMKKIRKMVQYDYLTWYNLKNIKRDFIFKMIYQRI